MPTHSSITLFVSPNPSDRELTMELLREAGISAQAYDDLYCLSDTLPDKIGVAVVVEEALVKTELIGFREALRTQPKWSDLPVLIIASHETVSTVTIDKAFPDAGNVTLLARPLSPTVLVSAVRGALRSRERQYEVRDLLRERDESLKHRDEFLAMLAHELRNPLAPIRNAVHLQKMLKIEEPVFVRTRGLVERQVANMTRLVNDLLDVSRLELGKVQIQKRKMNLNEAVLSAVDACADIVRERSHSLELDLTQAPLLVSGDIVRIEQIVCNLLTNACKYTPASGSIRIATSRKGDNAMLALQDSGVGIPPEMIERIFDLFMQNKRTLARSEGGLGIGLTVVKRLVELHGGQIHAISNGDGKGSTFEVTLPLAPAGQEDPVIAEEPLKNKSRCRVLVIEDNPDIRESLAMLLQVWGHEVHFASTGPEGVKCARELKPTVAIIDIGLPGLNGYEVARSIRSDASDWPQKVKLVAMTGYGQPSDITLANAAGFDTHLLKPVDPMVLESVLVD